MGTLDTFEGPSPASMTCSENFRFDTNDFNRYLPKIIYYLHLAE